MLLLHGTLVQDFEDILFLLQMVIERVRRLIDIYYMGLVNEFQFAYWNSAHLEV